MIVSFKFGLKYGEFVNKISVVVELSRGEVNGNEFVVLCVIGDDCESLYELVNVVWKVFIIVFFWVESWVRVVVGNGYDKRVLW